MVDTYFAEYEGQTFCRSSDRTYSHAVVARGSADDLWVAFGWRGSEDLARRAMSEARSRGFSDVVVVPVTSVKPGRVRRGR